MSDSEVIRPATENDLPQVAAIWYEAAVEDEPDPPTLVGTPSLYLHEVETRELYVVERQGTILAFAAVINRGPVAFVADLFVSAAHRSTGLGQRLLRHILPDDGRACWTVSSSDPRALPLYIRFGLGPRWPHIQLRANLADLGRLPSDEIDVIQAADGDKDFIEWDAELGGRRRPQDHAYWIRRRGGVPLWFMHSGRRIGYVVAQTRSDDLLMHPDAVTLGPIGTRAREDAVACVLAAVAWAQQRAAVARISLTGPHPALAPLLEVGFRIVEVETFCATSDESLPDVQRYVSSGGDLF